MIDKTIKRYSAYFFGWCQAFGEHEASFADNDDINWLYGESRIGVVVAAQMRRRLLRELAKGRMPRVLFSCSDIQVNELRYPMVSEKDRVGLRSLVNFLKDSEEVHMYLTNHFCYPPGTKILTFAAKKPLAILYKEIAPLAVQLLYE